MSMINDRIATFDSNVIATGASTNSASVSLRYMPSDTLHPTQPSNIYPS